MSDDLCEHCGVCWDDHDYEHQARECYPQQIERLKSMLVLLAVEPPTRTWTRETPTKEGWYWYKSERDTKVRMLEVITDNDRLEVRQEGLARYLSYYNGCWYGPLDSPPHMEE